MASIFEQVRSIVSEQLGVDEERVTEGASFVDDLGVDQDRAAELVRSIAKKFGRAIPDDAIEKITTVGQLVDYIRR